MASASHRDADVKLSLAYKRFQYFRLERFGGDARSAPDNYVFDLGHYPLFLTAMGNDQVILLSQ